VRHAFVSLWGRAERYDQARGSVRSWLLSAVRERANNSRRGRQAGDGRDGCHPRIDRWALAPRSSGSEPDLRETARRALAGLPTDERQVIELAYFDGLTHRQIAQRLALPDNTVKHRMRLGLQRLGTVVEPERRPGGR
jgi:RNA polymerase sigma-70 factor (ECF subfamily)